MTYKNLLGNKIKELRGDTSLRDFAEKIGISHTYLSSLEKGVDPRTNKPVNVTADTIIRIGDKLGINPHELFALDLEDKSERNFSYSSHEVVFPEEVPIAPGTSSIYGNHQDNLEYFSDKPELMDIYKEIHNSESLQLLFDSAKDLTPQDLETVLMIIKGIKSERNKD